MVVVVVVVVVIIIIIIIWRIGGFICRSQLSFLFSVFS